jgi:hypothetical protein
MTEHPLLAPRLALTADFTGQGVEDQIGHGTKVAILTVLNAPMVRLHIGKVYAADGAAPSIKLERLLRGLDWVAEVRPRILGLSIGVAAGCDDAPGLCDRIRKLLDAGMEVVVSAEARCPAACDERISVVDVVDLSTQLTLPGAVPDWVVGFRTHPAQVPMIPFSRWQDMVSAASSTVGDEGGPP